MKEDKEYDLEIVMLSCKKLNSRLCDFKKYGILNIKEKSIKINVILSNSEEITDIEKNWPKGVDINVIRYSNPNYAQNIHKFFLEYDLSSNSRWIMKLDDDSTTDISGLINNLDTFYNYEEPYYLASSCSKFMGPEYWIAYKYLDEMEEHGSLLFSLRHEIECSVISKKAINKILKNPKCINLLKKRSELERGATDVVLALASSIAKIYPIDCPFLTHLPALRDFSLLPGGFKNHIHLISRNLDGENFLAEQRSNHLFLVLTKIVDGSTSKLEKEMEEKKIEIDKVIYKFKSNHILERMKIVNNEPNISYEKRCLRSHEEKDSFMWLEEDGIIKIVNSRGVVKELKYDGKSNKIL
jgi:hypothetical protein